MVIRVAAPSVVTATPTSSAALVSHACIMMDGDIVAESRRQTRATFSDEVTLTSRLPAARVAGR